MTNQLAVGVDIGGTRTKIGLVELVTGKVIELSVNSTEKRSAAVFLDSIGDALTKFKFTAAAQNSSIIGIGFGVPGFVYDRSLVDSTYGFLEFMEDYPLADIITKKFGLPCVIDNDARVVALGEANYGRGIGYSRVLSLTLGTGLGVGFAIDGKLDGMPFNHMAGHMTVTSLDTLCYCGKSGCLESLVSATGITSLALNAGWEIALPLVLPTPENIFSEQAKGNKTASLVVDQLLTLLKAGIDNFINIYAPDIIILGGGMSKALKGQTDYFKDDRLLRPFKNYHCAVVVSDLGEQSGILGAAALL